MAASFQVFGDRDETQGILLCEKYTLNGALGFAADMAEHWDRLTVYQIKEDGVDNRVAIVSLKPGA